MGTIFGSAVTGSDSGDTIVGTPGDDVLEGGNGADLVVGMDGNDTLRGGGSADVILGGIGDDTIWGGTGQDHLRGGQGDDTIVGGAGADFISGDRGFDILSGGSGDDTFFFDALIALDNSNGPVAGDVIPDFEVGDTLALTGFNLQPFGQFMRFEQDGDDTVIVYSEFIKNIWFEYEIVRVLNANYLDVQDSTDLTGSSI